MSLQQNLINGDLEALEVVYRKYYSKVYAIVLNYCRNSAKGEDMAQEVFMKFWRNRKKINPTLTIDHQLFVLSKNIVYNHLKRELRQRIMLEEYLNTSLALEEDQHLHTEEHMRSVKSLIEQLPKKQREIFKMHRFEGLTYDEIATYFNISKHTVATHLTTAMTFLRKNVAIKFVILTSLLG